MITNTIGTVVELRTTHELHNDDKKIHRSEADDVSTSFASMLKGAMNKVNNLQVDAEDVTSQMIHSPESVDIHTVMIAQQKAEVALAFTKSVRDEAVRAYRDLINLR